MKKILFLFWASVAFAGKVEIASIETGNSGIDAQTIEMLVRSAVVQSGDTPVESSDRKLRVNLMPLGSSIIVVAETSEDGSVENSVKLKAQNPEELDIVIERTVSAALSGKSPKENEEVTNITQEEENELQARKGTKRYRHLSLGPMFWHNMHGSHLLGFAINYGQIWEVSPHAAITLQDYNAFSFGEELVTHLTVLIGGRYYFTPRRISPYFGIGLGIGTNLSTCDDMATFGFAGGASLGIVFFRTSETQLEIGAEYDIVLDGFGTTHAVSKAEAFIGLNF